VKLLPQPVGPLLPLPLQWLLLPQVPLQPLLALLQPPLLALLQ
jgi:hypothetical protein